MLSKNMHNCFLFLSRAEHIAGAAVYLYVYLAGGDDSNFRNKVLEASHGKRMHMRKNMWCSGKPWAVVTIFGTMSPKVYFSHCSASHSPHKLTDCLLLWLSQYSLFFSATFSPAVLSALYFGSYLNKVLVEATGITRQNLSKNRTVTPLSTASLSFLLQLAHPCMFHM